DHCLEMRDYLGIPADRVEFKAVRLADFSADSAQQGRFDQVIFLDVIEHIRDDGAALRQLHRVMADDGFIFVATPDRDWQDIVTGGRVTRHEDGWHVRNGYTFEQLERVLDENGFEPVDRLRYGTLGSSVVEWLQHRVFRRYNDILTVLLLPLLVGIGWLLSPWKRTRTIFVIARKRPLGADESAVSAH